MTEQTAPQSTFVPLEAGTLVTVDNKTWVGYVGSVVAQDEKKTLVQVLQGPTDKKNSQIGTQWSVKTKDVRTGATLRPPKPAAPETPAA